MVQVFPANGPHSAQFVAYDPDRYSPCQDSECKCRRSAGNVRGYGATAEDALEDYWAQLGGSDD